MLVDTYRFDDKDFTITSTPPKNGSEYTVEEVLNSIKVERWSTPSGKYIKFVAIGSIFTDNIARNHAKHIYGSGKTLGDAIIELLKEANQYV